MQVRSHEPPGVALDASSDRASSPGEPVPVSALWSAPWGGGQFWAVTLHLRMSQGITKCHVRDTLGFLLSEDNDFQAWYWTHS